MANLQIRADQLSETLSKILEDYQKEIVDVQKSETKVAMKNLVKETKEAAPERRPKYYKQITSKVVRDDMYGEERLWYVKAPDYRLSHLLEYGHAKKNGGRTKAFHFIEQAFAPIAEIYFEKIKEAIERIG